MGYAPTRGRRRNLRSVEALEAAMRDRDLNGRELGRLTDTSAQTISQLRLGMRMSVPAEVGDAIERVLRVRHGQIFGGVYTVGANPAGDGYEAVAA